MGSGSMRRAPRAPDNPENTLRAGFTFRTPGPRPASRDLSRGFAPRPPPREFAPPRPFRMSRKKFILALDQGTTSSRALIFEHRGRIRASAQEAFTPHFPKPGWVEHRPADLWATSRRTALAALARAKLTGASVAALRLTNQRETTVLWDRATGRPLAPAIVWQDRRTAPLCARLRRRGLEPLFRARTRLLLDPYFSGTKVACSSIVCPAHRRHPLLRERRLPQRLHPVFLHQETPPLTRTSFRPRLISSTSPTSRWAWSCCSRSSCRWSRCFPSCSGDSGNAPASGPTSPLLQQRRPPQTPRRRRPRHPPQWLSVLVCPPLQ